MLIKIQLYGYVILDASTYVAGEELRECVGRGGGEY
jgi:hypothetical protein